MSKKILSLVSLLLIAVLLLAPTASAANDLLIGIPDDATNGGRAIKLLESIGLIEVDPAAGWTPELKDITAYHYNIEIVPAQANTLPSTLDDFGASTINGTYAVPNGLVPSRDGLAVESQSGVGGEDGNPFVNVVAARSSDTDNELYRTIQEAFQSDLVAQYLIAKYKEAYIPAFEYEPTEYQDEELLALIDGYKTDKSGKTVVRVGVVGAANDHWKACQYVLDQLGADIYIKLVEFDSYSLPNEALNSGDIDLNSFQHKAYLAKEIDAQGYEIETVFDTLMAPLTLYSKQFDSVDALKEAAGTR